MTSVDIGLAVLPFSWPWCGCDNPLDGRTIWQQASWFNLYSPCSRPLKKKKKRQLNCQKMGIVLSSTKKQYGFTSTSSIRYMISKSAFPSTCNSMVGTGPLDHCDMLSEGQLGGSANLQRLDVAFQRQTLMNNSGHLL